MDRFTVLVKKWIPPILVTMFFGLIFHCGNVDALSEKIEYIPWGEKCKIPKPGEFLYPSEECDNSKGIFCQMYTNPPASLCGCRIEQRADLSYDPLTRECRRRVRIFF